MLRSSLADEESTLESDIHRRVPGRFRKRFQFSGNDLHCVVDDNVDAAALVDDCFDETIDVGSRGDISDHRKALAAEPGGLPCRGFGRRWVDVVDDDMGAFARISQNDIAADTAAATRNQCHLVLQSHGVPPKAVWK
ncbi:MAG TPA: hypothetical protein VI137_05935 [Pseudolabrys sp.]